MIRRVLSALVSPFRPGPPVRPLMDWELNPYLHPSQASHGYEGHLVDRRGNDYIDYLAAWGANLLGYGYPAVADAMCAQARAFAGLGLPYPQFWALGDLLCRVIPCAEIVRYGKNGSDATMGATRLARAITGRDLILFHGYHGFHDWYMASTPCQGIPEPLRPLIRRIPALTAEGVAQAFDQHRGEVACLILDPMLPPIADPDTMREVREIVRSHGAILIFDEVVTGFRVAPGGMQEVWGVAPDLACYGKGMANGMPISALVGRKEVMDHLPSINYGMTFEGEALSIAAAVATITEITQKNVCGALAEKGRRLKEAYAHAANQGGVQTEIGGPDARPHLVFADQAGIPERELRWLMIQELTRRGVLTLGTFSLCYTHHDKDLGKTTDLFDTIMPIIRKAIERRSTEGLLHPKVRQSMYLQG